MKRITFGMVGLMVLSLASFAHGEEYDAEKTLKSFGDFVVGGTWHSQEDGKEMSIEFSWFGDGKFLRSKEIGDGNNVDGIGVIGINPKTTKVTVWHFSAKGLRVSTMSQVNKSVWNAETEFTDEDGLQITWKGTVVRIGPNELHRETTELTVNGEKQEPLPTHVSKRHKS